MSFLKILKILACSVFELINIERIIPIQRSAKNPLGKFLCGNQVGYLG